jgi:PAS domain S-box-containing protein
MQDNERRRVEAVGRTNLDITERKRAEEAVRSSEEQLRLALKGANAAAWKWNIETGEATWSPEMYVLHGRDPETVPPSYDEWLASVHPEDRERVRANVRNALESGGSAYGSEYRVQLLSGEIRWIIALGTIERSREGAPLRMSGIDLHITDRKQAAAARPARKSTSA